MSIKSTTHVSSSALIGMRQIFVERHELLRVMECQKALDEELQMTEASLDVHEAALKAHERTISVNHRYTEDGFSELESSYASVKETSRDLQQIYMAILERYRWVLNLVNRARGVVIEYDGEDDDQRPDLNFDDGDEDRDIYGAAYNQGSEEAIQDHDQRADEEVLQHAVQQMQNRMQRIYREQQIRKGDSTLRTSLDPVQSQLLRDLTDELAKQTRLLQLYSSRGSG